MLWKFTMWLLGHGAQSRCEEDVLASPPPLRAKSSNEVRGWVSLPSWESPTTQSAFTEWQSTIFKSRYLSKFWGKKSNAATKVTLQEPPKISNTKVDIIVGKSTLHSLMYTFNVSVLLIAVKLTVKSYQKAFEVNYEVRSTVLISDDCLDIF